MQQPNVINRVVIVGGTHGNERIGVQLVKKFSQYPNLVRRPSFSTQTLLGNPQAAVATVRYIDRDLNRSFERDRLKDQTLESYEDRLAREIDRTFGPHSDTAADVIVDLHSTTTEMGLTVIIDQEEQFTLQLAAYLQQKNASIKVYSTAGSGRNQDALRSLARFGFGLEVGSLAQGVLNADLFQKTEALIYTILDALEQYNGNEDSFSECSLTLYRYLETVNYPTDDSGEMQAMVHPQLQFQDYQPLCPGEPMFLTFEGETIVYEGESVVYPVFINEAAYYEKGIAMCLTQKEQVVV